MADSNSNEKYKILLLNTFMKDFYKFHDEEYDTLEEAKEEVKRMITEEFIHAQTIQIVKTVYKPKVNVL
jgi:hypothetical protein